MKIILASASPRRRELMKLITEDFESISPDVDETVPESVGNNDVSLYLASLKAKAVSELYPEDIVIGCDTVVEIDDKILGKPKNADQCREYLRLLSGREHTVSTGVSIRTDGKESLYQCRTYVRFYELTDSDIEEYIATGEPFDKAGGYGIQGKGSLLVEKIDGDYFNVVGLPVASLNRELKKFIKGE